MSDILKFLLVLIVILLVAGVVFDVGPFVR